MWLMQDILKIFFGILLKSVRHLVMTFGQFSLDILLSPADIEILISGVQISSKMITLGSGRAIAPWLWTCILLRLWLEHTGGWNKDPRTLLFIGQLTRIPKHVKSKYRSDNVDFFSFLRGNVGVARKQNRLKSDKSVRQKVFRGLYNVMHPLLSFHGRIYYLLRCSPRFNLLL